MEKAVTALFNQLLLLFSIMQGINAEPLTAKNGKKMKGNEGLNLTFHPSGPRVYRHSRQKGEG
ncbi:hypothetical protein [Segatella hominis]|uniref:Uncharacterized protein n=1 Tax=Segatella hominis TaxID=2518605 RepID=A0A4Y8VVL5_9BACT|nr:hypothetical protein [Segatella hominis]TFH84445.1 hypothetical protein EXN75_01175 [Segatella hominis]